MADLGNWKGGSYIVGMQSVLKFCLAMPSCCEATPNSAQGICKFIYDRVHRREGMGMSMFD